MTVDASCNVRAIVTASLGLENLLEQTLLQGCKHAPRRPTERKVRLHDTRAIVEQLDYVRIIDSRVPFLPELWGR